MQNKFEGTIGMFEYYTAALAINLFALIIMQIFIAHSNTLTRVRRKLFHLLFAVISVAACCEWLGTLFDGADAGLRWLHILVKMLELMIAPLAGYLFAWIIEQKWVKGCIVLLITNAGIEFVSAFYGFVYFVDESNYYHHESCYWIYIIAYILSLLYVMHIIFSNTKKYQYVGNATFLLIAILLIVGVCTQLFNSELKVDYLTLTVASIMMYVFTLEMIQQTDEQTGLLNRRGFENAISHMEKPCVVAFFDVDQFKAINDVYGHAFGDAVLQQIGDSIKKSYANYGKCFRYGGDEFCVILTKNLNHIESLNHEFFDRMSELREKESRIPLVSIGYASFAPKNQSIIDVVAEADAMMYQFKESRR